MPRPFLSPRTAILAACALLAPTLAHAAPSAADTAAYIVNNHNGKVTITNAAGKSLYKGQAATSTIQMVLTNGPDTGAKTSPDKPVFLTLEDAKNTHLWQTQVAVLPPLKFNVGIDSKVHGTTLTFTPRTLTPLDKDTARTKRLALTISSSNAPTSTNADGQVAQLTLTATGGTLLTPDGSKLTIHQDAHGVTATGPNGQLGSVKIDPHSKNATMNLSGQTFTVTNIKRDGKHYYSFPWHGFPVLVENGCSFNFSSDGELVINAPKPAK